MKICYFQDKDTGTIERSAQHYRYSVHTTVLTSLRLPLRNDPEHNTTTNISRVFVNLQFATRIWLATFLSNHSRKIHYVHNGSKKILTLRQFSVHLPLRCVQSRPKEQVSTRIRYHVSCPLQCECPTFLKCCRVIISFQCSYSPTNCSRYLH